MYNIQLEEIGISDIIYDRVHDYTFFLDANGEESQVPTHIRNDVGRDLRYYAELYNLKRVFCSLDRYICKA
jgi:hypothetical protein